MSFLASLNDIEDFKQDEVPTRFVHPILPPVARFTSPSGTEADFTSPPATSDGSAPIINFRVTVFNVGAVDTKSETAKIKIGVVMHWTDPRISGWTDFLLPNSLWGPEVYLFNGIDCVPEYEQFVLFRADDGRLKRIINYASTIKCEMNLKHFPFDSQTIEAHFVNISHWRTLDCTSYGSSPNTELYRLAPVEAPGEGNFFSLFFDGLIQEFTLMGNKALLEEPDRESAGYMITRLRIQFDVERTTNYYMFKAFMPLYLLTTVSIFSLDIEPEGEDSLVSKLALIFTMFLAAVALQSVIAEAVPKVDFLTTIDWVAIASIVYLCAMSVFSVVVEKLNTIWDYSWDTCRRVNGEFLLKDYASQMFMCEFPPGQFFCL